MTKIDASNYIENNSIYGYVQMTGHKDSFIDGAECADNHPNSLWIKFTDELPPLYELIIIAMKDKNKEDGKWIYNLCVFYGGNYRYWSNWIDKVNYETPIYWMPITEPPKE